MSGVVRAEHLSLLGRLLMVVTSHGAGDYRDWDRIDAWGDGVARVLTALPAPAPRGRP